MRRNLFLIYALCVSIMGTTAWIANAGGADQCLVQTLLSPTPEPFDYFGAALAIVGDDVLIGAHNVASDGINAGAAYLLNRYSRFCDKVEWPRRDAKLTAIDSTLLTPSLQHCVVVSSVIGTTYDAPRFCE